MSMKFSKGPYQKMNKTNRNENTNAFFEWVLRIIKGVFIGIGFITPGFSGGVMAVVFGIYEPLMRFLGNLRENFIKNALFFFPVGIGGIIGVVVFSKVIDFAFSYYPAEFTSLFIGFITGTFPTIFKTSGKKGRKAFHWGLLVIISVATVLFMRWMENFQGAQLSPSFLTWMISGILIGLGVVLPGLSPSNFLIYLGLYQSMANGIWNLDLAVIIPLTLGGALIVLVLAKVISLVFNKHYSFMYHLILGVVVGSTIAIIPSGLHGWTIAVSAGLFIVGALISYGLTKIDEKYAREECIFESYQ